MHSSRGDSRSRGREQARGEGKHGEGGANLSLVHLVDKASTVDARRTGSAQIVIPQASMCTGSSDKDEKEHAQDDESGDDGPEGTGVKESKRQGRGRGRGKRKRNNIKQCRCRWR